MNEANSDGQAPVRPSRRVRNYQIAEPANSEHETLSFFAPEPDRRADSPEAYAEYLAPGATEKRAIWIVHGMGQQVPFETVDALAAIEPA